MPYEIKTLGKLVLYIGYGNIVWQESVGRKFKSYRDHKTSGYSRMVDAPRMVWEVCK